jgi:hypothetical protein
LFSVSWNVLNPTATTYDWSSLEDAFKRDPSRARTIANPGSLDGKPVRGRERREAFYPRIWREEKVRKWRAPWKGRPD